MGEFSRVRIIIFMAHSNELKTIRKWDHKFAGSMTHINKIDQTKNLKILWILLNLCPYSNKKNVKVK